MLPVYGLIRCLSERIDRPPLEGTNGLFAITSKRPRPVGLSVDVSEPTQWIHPSSQDPRYRSDQSPASLPADPFSGTNVLRGFLGLVIVVRNFDTQAVAGDNRPREDLARLGFQQ